MRLSDDKISDIAFKLADQLELDDRARFAAPKNIVRTCIHRTIVSELQFEDGVIETVLRKLETMKSVKHGSPQWEKHAERLYREEMAKTGRNWDIEPRDVTR